MTGAETRFRALLNAILQRAETSPEIAEFAPGLPRAPRFAAPVPNRLPVHRLLPGMLAQSGPATRNLADAAGGVLDDADWQQTYTEDQVGHDFMAKYGWFNVISPEGPFLSDDWRVAIAVWGDGLIYPAHRHTPEELYVVIAGGALFQTEGRADAWLGPGETRHHPSDMLHGMVLEGAPLVALVFWKGRALMRASTLEAQ